MMKDGGKLEVSDKRGNGNASYREEPLGLMGLGAGTRKIGV
jgi:hypothetical protein